jgi:hypothetical protein
VQRGGRVLAEAWQAHGAWITADPGALGDDVMARFTAATAGTTPRSSRWQKHWPARTARREGHDKSGARAL